MFYEEIVGYDCFWVCVVECEYICGFVVEVVLGLDVEVCVVGLCMLYGGWVFECD